jgi:hypothetical protein
VRTFLLDAIAGKLARLAENDSEQRSYSNQSLARALPIVQIFHRIWPFHAVSMNVRPQAVFSF